VSSDSVESHSEFAVEYGLPFYLLSDEGGTVRELFGVPSFTLLGLPGRVTYVIDKSGRVIHVFQSMLKPKKHIEEALTALGNG